jgi:hypothetical protein
LFMFRCFQISKNAYNYDAHIQLIELLKKMGELIKLREAREQMSKLFPLTEGMYFHIEIKWYISTFV